jgi:uncharacterized RDD family membrane protein YckC
VSELVTGEAVVLELRLARLASRSVAFAIDAAAQLGMLASLLLPFLTGGTGLDGALTAATVLLVIVFVLVGYPVLVETLTRGRTLGKLVMGLRVVRDDGGPIRFRHALTRGLAGFFVDFWALGLGGAVALVVSLSSARGKRVGDYLAGTVVLRERTPALAGGPVTMPASLAGWAAGLDVSRLPDELALAVRQYLGRYHKLDALPRDRLGSNLADEVGRNLGVALPAGEQAAMYLAAVLAERRTRHEQGMAAHQNAGPSREPPAMPPPAGSGTFVAPG